MGHGASVARAEDAKRTLVIAAQARSDALDAAVVRELRAALSEHAQVALMAPAPLDLEAVQLAIDCPDESARCLREVAERMEARVLIVPAVARDKAGRTLRLLYFDSKDAAEPRTVVRRVAGAAADRELPEAVPGMVHELLGVEDEPAELPEPSEPAPAPAPAPATADRESAPGSALPIGPLVLGGAGVGVIAAGLVVGALMQKTENDYAARTIDSEMQAQSAEMERERGQQQAVVANVLLGTGVAAVVAAGVWLAFASGGGKDSSTQTALVPVLGPRAVGVSLLGTWGEAGR